MISGYNFLQLKKYYKIAILAVFVLLLIPIFTSGDIGGTGLSHSRGCSGPNSSLSAPFNYWNCWCSGRDLSCQAANNTCSNLIPPTHNHNSHPDCDSLGRLIIEKTVASGWDASQTFIFNGPGSGIINRAIREADPEYVRIVWPNEGFGYPVTETIPAGWPSPVITCDDTDSYGNGNTAYYKIGPAERVTCTFLNGVQTGTVRVRKIIAGSSSGQRFDFQASGFPEINLGHGELFSITKIPGTYTVSEIVPAGWDVTSVTCDDSNSLGSGNIATFVLAANETVTCTFTNTRESLPDRNLSVSVGGSGSGSVTGTGINCPSDCTQSYPWGSSVTISATPAAGSTFTAWGGDCAPAGTNSWCTLTMNVNKSATATFGAVVPPPPVNYTLSLSVGGSGSGEIRYLSDSGLGRTCPPSCTESYTSGSTVTLQAGPSGGSTFAGWTVDCLSSPGPTCSLTMSASRFASAIFNAPIPPPPPDEPPPIYELGCPLGSCDLLELARKACRQFLIYTTPLLVIMILLAAYDFLMGGAKPSRITRAKKTLMYGIIGYLIILLACFIPEILAGLF